MDKYEIETSKLTCLFRLYVHTHIEQQWCRTIVISEAEWRSSVAVITALDMEGPLTTDTALFTYRY